MATRKTVKKSNAPPKPGSKDYALYAHAERRAVKPSGEPLRARRRIGGPRVIVEPSQKLSYFASGNGKSELRFVSTGCAVMDEALGGGWCLGRTANIVGDKSAGKTLLAMETVANFCAVYAGPVRYAESEAAFDKPYAGELGMPLDRIEFNEDDQPLETVEDLYNDMERWLAKHEHATEGLYIIDSLDALSDAAEMEGEFNQASYGGTKPKAIGQLFRRLIQKLEDRGILFIVVSQIRDKLNAMPFGETKTRSGGKALDFYATHIVWLVQKGKIKRTIAKIERIVGVDVTCQVRKNKIGLPFRNADYSILFGYGIDDLQASVDWLIKHNRAAMLAEVGMSQAGHAPLVRKIRDEGGEGAKALRARLRNIIRREWSIVETDFLPKSSKY